MNLRNRIVAAYVLWGITALGTTLTWTTRIDGATFSGQTAGFNGGMVLILGMAAAGLIAWWDRGSRFDTGRIRMAVIVGVLAILVILRNMYDIYDASAFKLGFGIWVCLLAVIPAAILTRSLEKR